MTSPSRVGTGERVRTGEVVGDIGRTGNAASTPCHLHIEIRVGGEPVDPEPLPEGVGWLTSGRQRAGTRPLIARMLHDFNIEFSEPTPGAEVLERRVLAFVEDGRMTYLLGGDGRATALGFAQVSFRPSVWADEPIGYLEELYVVPERRGEGIGRALMEAVLALAREHGAAGMEVITGEDDTAARALYESVGFRNQIEGEENARALFYELEL